MKMKIVRKIDQLGRIVIPKDVRESLNIHLGDTVEIYVENNCVMLKKKSMEPQSDTILS